MHANCCVFHELILWSYRTISIVQLSLQDCAIGRVFVNHSTPNAPIGLLMGKDLDTGHYKRVDDMDFDILPDRSKLQSL